MRYMRWFILAALAFVAGAAYVQYLVTHPLQISLYLSVTFVALFAAIVVIARYIPAGRRVIAIVLALLAYTAHAKSSFSYNKNINSF